MENAALTVTRAAVDLVLPGLMPLLEAAVAASRLAEAQVKKSLREENDNLYELLDALIFKVESEYHEGRVPTPAWINHFHTLCNDVGVHTVECERRDIEARLKAAFEKPRRVKKLYEGIQALSETIEFQEADDA
ncbi:hypothetical protein Gpo141_00010844 [Globisporangium polare]